MYRGGNVRLIECMATNRFELSTLLVNTFPSIRQSISNHIDSRIVCTFNGKRREFYGGFGDRHLISEEFRNLEIQRILKVLRGRAFRSLQLVAVCLSRTCSMISMINVLCLTGLTGVCGSREVHRSLPCTCLSSVCGFVLVEPKWLSFLLKEPSNLITFIDLLVSNLPDSIQLNLFDFGPLL